MLRKLALASGVAALCAGVAVGAQEPPTAPQPEPTSQQEPSRPEPAPEPEQARTSEERTATIEGCVYEEKDIPGRTPNVAEQAGVMEDYILVASAAPGGTPGAEGTTGAVGTTGAAAPKMFKLEHAPDEQLKAMVGKRVQVTGRMEVEAGDTTAARPQAGEDQSVGPDQINLPELEVATIREIGGECPSKPELGQ